MLVPPWHSIWPALIEIALLFGVVYAILRFLEGTRGAGVLRGLVFFIVVALMLILVFVDMFQMHRIRYLLGQDLLMFLLLIVMLFQPEIRRFLLRLGEAPMIRRLFRSEAPVVPAVVEAAFTLAHRKLGGLIAIEREVGLGEYVERGTPLNGVVTSDLLVTIFWPGSPLHDGAVIIRGGRIAAAGCLFPLTDQLAVAKALGTRHRAAIGITERSDAVAVVVSEETREVSVAYRGQLRRGLEREQLRRVLEETLIEAVAGTSAESA